MRTRLPLILLTLLSCAAVGPVSARQGGDFAACKVDVEGDRLTMPTGPAMELGADGEDICLQFMADIHDALEASPAADDVDAEDGDGFSPDTAFHIGERLAERNPMVPVLRHYRGIATGRFAYFMLIARANDRYILEVTGGPDEGPIWPVYYDYTAWVTRQLEAR